MKQFLLFLLLCSAPLVQPRANVGAASSDLDQFVEKWLTDNKASGVSVGLIKDGRLAFAKGYGLANRQTKLVPTGDTVWSMASCSKPTVGIAALKLVDQGKLDLDKDVGDYLGFTLRNPNFPDEKITMRQLLGHASSIMADPSQDNDLGFAFDPPQQLEKDVRDWLLVGGAQFANGAYWDASAKPGAKYAYSNVGSTVAGLVVEKASGQLFNEFCNQHIFAPLGLAATRWFFRELPDPAKVAIPYDESFQPYGHYGFAKYPSGQLRSSVADFSKLLLLLMNQGELGGQRILSTASVAEMQRVQFPALDPEGGLFLGVGASGGGVPQFYHQGAESGVGTYFLYQANKIGALFMSNGSLKSAGYDTLMKRLLDEIPKLQAPAPPTITAQPLSQTVAVGATVKFTVQALADPPVTVQWKFNDAALADSATISGAKTPTLTLTAVAAAQAGNYTVTITDPDGSTTSAAAVLMVESPIAVTVPAITDQSKGQTIATGASITLFVKASGDAPLSYQWKLNSADISGATSATLTLNNAQASNAGSYTVVVTNPAGSITSEPVIITVTAPPPPPPPQTGLLVDNGFRPTSDGFKFENYGKAEGRIDLTPAELQRMFGDRVFATANGAEKILTPAAQKWMEETSKSMNGGHCEGMAVVSLLIYARNLDSPKFGAARTVDLDLDGNPSLQREIAYWWATQVVDPTRSTEIFGTPTEVLDRLIEALKPGVKETYTVGVRQEGKGGHAVTPYAVEDKGGGIMDVLVYDNNHPNKERRLTVDRNKNTWQFSLSTNPAEPESIWAGDATTRSFSLSPSSPRLQTQVAPFLEESAQAVGLNGLNARPVFNEIWVDGNGVKILISDPQGKRYGYEGGKFYREIAGVTHRMLKGGDELWKDSPSPTYYVPVGLAFTLTLDGSAVQKETDTAVTMIGPGYDLSIEEIHLDPNQKDTIVFSPDGKAISYKTSSNESPEISLGFETPGADYDFTVKGVDIEAGSTLTIRLDKTKNTLSISTAGNVQDGTYALSMGRLDKDNAQYFDHDGIELRPNDTATLDFGKWAGNKATMPLMIDRDSNGTFDETIQLTDEEKVVVVAAKLSAQAVAGGKIKVSWPTSATDFILEANSTVSSTGWTAVPANQLSTEGANKVFTENGSSTTRFYRLRKN